MLVYNHTIKVDKRILGKWVKWAIEEYIPAIMATNLFSENKFFELLEQDDPGAATFVLQYFTNSREKYDKYIDEYSEIFTEMAWKKWGNSFIGFKTLMQSVH